MKSVGLGHQHEVDWPAVAYSLLWAAYLIDRRWNLEAGGKETWLQVDECGIGGPLLDKIREGMGDGD